MRLSILVATALLLTPYSGSGQKLLVKTKPKLDRAKSATIIAGRCAIIIRPDNKRIEWLKKRNSADEYNAVVNDNEYYIGTSIGFLNSVKVKQFEKLSNAVLSFKSSSGRYFNMSLASFDWGIILFNGRDKPIVADVTDIGSSYQAYMKKWTSYKHQRQPFCKAGAGVLTAQQGATSPQKPWHPLPQSWHRS